MPLLSNLPLLKKIVIFLVLIESSESLVEFEGLHPLHYFASFSSMDQSRLDVTRWYEFRLSSVGQIL